MPNQKNNKGKKSKRTNSSGDEQENGACAAATGGAAAAAAAPRNERSSGKRGNGRRCRSLVMLPFLPGEALVCLVCATVTYMHSGRCKAPLSPSRHLVPPLYQTSI